MNTQDITYNKEDPTAVISYQSPYGLEYSIVYPDGRQAIIALLNTYYYYVEVYEGVTTYRERIEVTEGSTQQVTKLIDIRATTQLCRDSYYTDNNEQTTDHTNNTQNTGDQA